MTIETKENLAQIEKVAETEKVTSGLHGEIGSILHWHLANYVYPNKLGRLFIDQTSFKAGGTPPARQLDLAFVAAGRMPSSIDEDVPLAPDIAVEVISRTDDWSDISNKAKSYIKDGVRLVWVIDPYDLNIYVYRADRHKLTLNLEDELDGEDVLPGFKLSVKSLFPNV